MYLHAPTKGTLENKTRKDLFDDVYSIFVLIFSK